MIWFILASSGLAVVYLVHCVGGMRLKSVFLPTAHWFRDIKLPNARSWRPKDLPLMLLRMLLVIFLASLWAAQGCPPQDLSQSRAGCLLVIDDTWSTHASWKSIEEKTARAQAECQPEWTWWMSQESPWQDFRVPPRASYRGKSLSEMFSSLRQWLEARRTSGGISRVVVVTDGQLFGDESRQDVEAAAQSIVKMGVDLVIHADPPQTKTNAELQILGRTVRLVNWDGKEPNLTARCGDRSGKLTKTGTMEWELRCGDIPLPAWVSVAVEGLNDLFSEDNHAEALWTSEKGKTHVIVVDHKLGTVLEKPSFFVEQASVLLPEFQFKFQAYDPLISGLHSDDVLIWFDPEDLSEVRPIAKKSKVVVWSTTTQVTEETYPDPLKVTFRQAQLSVPTNLICCFSEDQVPGTVDSERPLLTRDGDVTFHRVPLSVPTFRLPLSTGWPAYLYDLIHHLRNSRGIRVDRLSSSWSHWPLTRLATKENFQQEPVQGFPSGVYRFDDQLYAEAFVTENERSPLFVSDFQVMKSTSDRVLQSGDNLRSFWIVILLCLIFEGILSLRPVMVAAAFLLFFVPQAWSKGSQIGVVKQHSGVMGTVYRDLAREVSRRTSIELEDATRIIERMTSEVPLVTPFVYRSCEHSLRRESFSPQEWTYIEKLIHLDGVMTFDGCRFEPSVPLPADHPIFRSFYLIGSRTGCGLEKVYGESSSRHTQLLSFPSGLLVHAFPQVSDQCTEGWIRLAVNWVVYLFSSDYKSDQVHIPFILERIK